MRDVLTFAFSDHKLLGQKTKGFVLLIHPVSSIDDGLNCIIDLHDRDPVAAAFIFASLPEANYLANYVNAHISCINHIPAELLGKSLSHAPLSRHLKLSFLVLTCLVGPVGPRRHVVSLSPRYLPSMFTEPRPQHLYPTRLTTNGESELVRLQELATTPLPVEREPQKPGNFFLQGLKTSTISISISVVILGYVAVLVGRSKAKLF
jgi:hypothetical protein